MPLPEHVTFVEVVDKMVTVVVVVVEVVVEVDVVVRW